MADPAGDHDPSAPSLASAFQHERERTEELFARTAALVGRGCWVQAQGAFAAFDRRLRARIQRAEHRVLPLFEIKTGSPSELSRTLVREHRLIEAALEGLGACLRERRLDDAPACVRSLRQRLEEHDGRVGRLVFPLLDHLLTSDERLKLVAEGDDEGDGGSGDR